MLSKLTLLVLLVASANLIALTNSECVHNHFAHKVRKHFYSDLEDKRLLNEAVNGK